MSTACDLARTRLVAGADASAHAAACGACRAFAARLARVDRSLAAAAEHAASAALPVSLRARIVAAARPGVAPRGRLLDMLLRAAAVAAVLLAVFVALPGDALASPELPFADLRVPHLGLSETLARPASVLPSLADAPSIDLRAAPLGAAAGAAVGSALLAAAMWTLLRGRRTR